MKVYLCRGRRLNFSLTNITCEKVDTHIKNRCAAWHAKKGEASLLITSDDVIPFVNQSSTMYRKHRNRTWRNTNVVNKTGLRKDMASIKVTLEHMTSSANQLNVRVQGKLLQDIRMALGQDIRLKMEIIKASTEYNLSQLVKLFQSMVDDSNKLSMQDLLGKYFPSETQYNADMPLHTLKDNLTVAFCEDQISLPERWRHQWLDESTGETIELAADINLILLIAEPTFKENTESQNQDKLHDNENNDDVEIIASNGKIIKCKNSHLSDQSGILKILLKENGNKLTMSDISEQGVYSFLDYTYNRDIRIPMQNSSIAVELFLTAHKYGLECLRVEMKTILMDMPYLWFDINSVMRLFFFVAKLPCHLDLKLKALRVIKSNPLYDVVTCQQYQQLFQDLHQVSTVPNKMELARQLCDGLLSLPMIDVLKLPKL